MRWCVFCGSSGGNDPRFAAVAEDLGTRLAQAGDAIVYGGGKVGLMGAVADAALAAGGTVVGIIPEALAEREVAHGGLSALHVVDSMHTRKAMMNDCSDGFIMLPGGFGTLEEFCEVVTWVQLGIIDKPCIALNAYGYYDPLIAMFDRAHHMGFINERNRSIVSVVSSVDELLDRP
ncbi:MAG: TIGR00730 family Rossman fold protein [Candidatus Velthaea sp.]